MTTLRTRMNLRVSLEAAYRSGASIGLVPTMGSLHQGHLSLVHAAREECEIVVVSLFVNPTQFKPGEDFSGYPRDENRDAELLTEAGTDFLYAPDIGEIYPDGFSTRVEVDGLTEMLCGDPESRGTEHFRGVTTVVAKLFNSVSPTHAYFGQKDAQQAAVITRMTRDLNFPVEIRVLPTIRESDGLAMSSRNAYLSPDDRVRAVALSRALKAAADVTPVVSLGAGIEAAMQTLADAGIEPEYLEARDAIDLSPVAEANGRPILIAVAAQVGRARLIDNVLIHPSNQTTAPGAVSEEQMS